MKRTSLIRLGGLVAIVDGVVYVSQTFLLWPLVRNMRDTGLSRWDAVLLALGVMVPIAALHALERRHYGLSGTLASLTALVGVAITFVGVHNVSTMFPLIMGALVVSVGLIALGIVTITARVLPWWCGATLIVSSISPVSGPLGRVPWVLVGVALFRAAGRQTERPSRVR